MSRCIISLAVVAVLVAGSGCYQDDTNPTVAQRGKPLAKILLTDAPFPYDSVASVNIYVVRVEASAQTDTSGGGDWVLIAEPRKVFNLLTLQQGTTAFVGEGELPAGQYHAIRMTIDTSLSSVVWNSGLRARVNWQNWSGSTEEPLYALVEYPVNVPTDGAEIVIDFDVGRSFLYNFYGTNEFILMPQIRAINSAATGTIAGSVTSDYTGATRPIANANVTVCGSAACDPPNAYVVATSRSDSTGRYTIAFVRAGSYTVRVEQPDYPFLNPVIVADVTVTRGGTMELAVSLPKAGSGGGGYVRISGPSSVGVGGTISLRAAVGDAAGNPVSNPSVSWTSSNSGIAQVSGVGDTASVMGRQAGYATITAVSGQLSDTLGVQVVGSSAPVASVTVVPGSANLAIGDSVGFRAELRDSTGTLLTDRAVSWFATDSTVINVYPYGAQALVRPRAAGSASLRATSEGKTGQATITVH